VPVLVEPATRRTVDICRCECIAPARRADVASPPRLAAAGFFTPGQERSPARPKAARGPFGYAIDADA